MIAEWLSQLTPEDGYLIASAIAILIIGFNQVHLFGKNQSRIERLEQALELDLLSSPTKGGAESSNANSTRCTNYGWKDTLFPQQPKGEPKQSHSEQE